jgi:predicted nucleotidyltransferase
VKEIKFKEIIDYANKIKTRFKPQKIILFGSYAYGKPQKDSDVDLLVIMRTKLKPIEQAVIIRKEIPSPFPLDLIVRRPEEVKKRVKKGDLFLKTLLEKGIKL